MIPILYDKSEKLFKNNGIGRLSDTISCKVTEKRNSMYQSVLEYPIQGKLSEHLKMGNIIFCKIPYKNQCQPFDIVEVECTGNMMHVTAEHVSRRLKYAVFNRTTLFLVDPKTTFESIETDMRGNIIGIDDFHFMSDVTESDVKKYLNDSNVVLYSPDCAVGDSLMDFFEGQNGILSRKMTLSDGGKYVVAGYGDCGDFLFDNFNVSFLKQRGTDAGVKLRTGSNVQRMTFLEEDRQSVTAVCPVWKGRNPVTGGQMEKSLRDFDDSSDGIVYSDKKYEYHRIVKLDLSTVFEQSPTKSEMISESKRYIADHERNNLNSYCSYSIDVPQVKSDFLDCIELCDLVTIEDVDLKIQKKLKVTEIEYDSLRERITRLVVGNPKPTFPELLERKNSIFIDNVNRSLTRTDDLSQKTVVKQKTYPVGYDPAHPEKWENTGQKLVDEQGREMEEIAEVNRHPVFVYKESGGGSKIPILRFEQYIATHDKYAEDLQYTIPYNIVSANEPFRYAKQQPYKLVLNPFTFPVDALKVGSRFIMSVQGEMVINDETHGHISLSCTFQMRCDVKKIVGDTVFLEMFMLQLSGTNSNESYVCVASFVNKNLSEDRVRVIRNATCKILQQ